MQISDTTFSTNVSHPTENTTSGLLVVVFGIIIYIGRFQEVVPYFRILKLGAVATLLISITLIMMMIRGDFKKYLFNNVEFKTFALLFICGVLSTATALNHSFSFNYLIFTFLRIFLFVVLIINTIRTMADIRRVIWVFVGVVTILALPAFFGDFSLDAEHRFKSIDGTYDTNDIALVMAISLPFMVGLISQSTGIVRITGIFSLVAALTMIIRSHSRGGFLALVTVLGAMLFRSKSINRLQKISVVMVFFLLFYFFAPDSYLDRMGSIGVEDYNVTATYGRKQIWERSWKLMKEYPLVGAGMGCFEVANAYHFESEIGGVAWRATAHNSFLLIGVELGFTGLILYCTMLLSGLKHALQEVNLYSEVADRRDDLWIASALEASIVGFIVGGFFLSFSNNPTSYFLVALVVAYQNVVGRK